MLRMASFPPTGVRFADGLPITRVSGERGRRIISREGRMIGVADIDEIREQDGSLGYWFDRSEWGQGYAHEAACAVVRFAREDAGLLKLTAGHAYDNPASGRILSKLGFRPFDVVPRLSRARGETIMQHRYVLNLSGS